MENDVGRWRRVCVCVCVCVLVDEAAKLFVTSRDLDVVTSEPPLPLIVGLVRPRTDQNVRRFDDNSSQSGDTPLISAPHLAHRGVRTSAPD